MLKYSVILSIVNLADDYSQENKDGDRMRVTSNMINEGYLRMQSNEYFKNASTETDDDDDNKTASVTIAGGVTLEKGEDSIIVSKKGSDDTKKIIEEISLTSKRGMALSDYISGEETDTLQDKLNEINQTARSLSLANYL